jgi:hypothetical protein
MPVNRDHKFMISVTDEEMSRLRHESARSGFQSVAAYVRSRMGMSQVKNAGGPRIGAGRPTTV